MNYGIFIPSIGRPEKCAKTAEKFAGTAPVTVVTQRMYERDYALALRDTSARLVVLPQAYTPGVALARDFIMQYAAARGFDAVIQSDDDVSIGRRDARGYALSIGSHPGCYADVAKFLAEMATQNGYALSGLRRRQGCCGSFCLAPPIRVVAIAVAKYMAAGLSYAFAGPLSVCEDFWVALSLLRQGYAWHVDVEYVNGDAGSNAAGGCSTFRTADLQARCVKRLADEFPEWVQVVQKDSNYGPTLNPRFKSKAIAEYMQQLLEEKNK